MTDLASTIAGDFASYYEYIGAHTHKWVDGLTHKQFWHNPYGYGNSVGHLILHMTGNLNYYIGSRIADTGYVRNRDLEFTDATAPAKEEVMRKFDETIAMVAATVRKQGPQDWLAQYSAEREPEAKERFMVFLRCAGHAYHHVGQLIYLSKEFQREAEMRAVRA
jgi:hypothetical protein